MNEELKKKFKQRMIFLDQFLDEGSNILNSLHMHNLKMLREHIIEAMKEGDSKE